MIQKSFNGRMPASFRDPNGFLFWKDGILYRQINRSYKPHYETLISTGLYQELVEKKMLVKHEEVSDIVWDQNASYKTIRPDPIPFISYPYEWSFGQLKDAALLTLKIQEKALALGMTLKDASCYNIQFREGRPIFIDTPSFEMYEEGKPWDAYRQFCQHFLAPLALMSFRDVRLGQLLRVHLDGIPLDLASSLLPVRTRFSLGLFSHIHLHAKSQAYFAKRRTESMGEKYRLKKLSLFGLVDSLQTTVQKMRWNPGGTEWGEYYGNTNYEEESFAHKKRLVTNFLEQEKPESVWDMGANTGEFSRIASNKGIKTVAFDIDPAAVEKNYLEVKQRSETCILPLLLDLTNPSPALGWEGHERMSLIERGPADTVIALALIHHLAISNNLPFSKIAHFFQQICHKSLIIEFVPKSDSNARRLLSTRKDIFSDYSQQVFEEVFRQYFDIRKSVAISGSERTMYLMRKNTGLSRPKV